MKLKITGIQHQTINEIPVVQRATSYETTSTYGSSTMTGNLKKKGKKGAAKLVKKILNKLTDEAQRRRIDKGTAPLLRTATKSKSWSNLVQRVKSSKNIQNASRENNMTFNYHNSNAQISRFLCLESEADFERGEECKLLKDGEILCQNNIEIVEDHDSCQKKSKNAIMEVEEISIKEDIIGISHQSGIASNCCPNESDSSPPFLFVATSLYSKSAEKISKHCLNKESNEDNSLRFVEKTFTPKELSAVTDDDCKIADVWTEMSHVQNKLAHVSDENIPQTKVENSLEEEAFATKSVLCHDYNHDSRLRLESTPNLHYNASFATNLRSFENLPDAHNREWVLFENTAFPQSLSHRRQITQKARTSQARTFLGQLVVLIVALFLYSSAGSLNGGQLTAKYSGLVKQMKQLMIGSQNGTSSAEFLHRDLVEAC